MAMRMSILHSAALVAFVLGVQAHAQAHDDGAWKIEREARFASVKAASPPQDATIATIKAKTAELIAAYAPTPARAIDRPPVVWRVSPQPVVVFDMAVAPRMVVVPAGEQTLGSPATEAGRRADETRHRMRFARAFAVSMFPVTFGEY